jgi:hypothetical protein
MADCHGFSRGQTPGSAVGFVVVFCRSREDQLSGFFTDLGKPFSARLTVVWDMPSSCDKFLRFVEFAKALPVLYRFSQR